MDALKLRKAIKSKKPNFRRQDSHKVKRIARTGYRAPKGIQSKMRLGHKSYARTIAVGYGSPAEAKNLHPSGLKPFIVSNLADLERLDVKTEGAIIAGTVGLKKKLELVKKAEELKVTILNIKDTKAFIADQEKSISDKKKAKESKKKSRDAKKQQKAKAAEKDSKKEKSEESSKDAAAEEKKKADKSDKDKVLTKKSDN